MARTTPTAACFLALLSIAGAWNPAPNIPPGGGPPGRYPSAGGTTTCLVSTSDAPAPSLRVEIEAQGPIPWSLPRFNPGDFAVRVSPSHPYALHNLGPKGGGEEAGAGDYAAQGWKPMAERGVLLATVRKDGAASSATGETFYGVAGVCCCCSRGAGYSMVDGGWAAGRPYSMDVLIAKAGVREQGSQDSAPSETSEGAIDFAATWLPWEDGWIGGWVNQPEYAADRSSAAGKWRVTGGHSPDLPEDASSMITWTKLAEGYGSQAKIRFQSVVASAGHGMLFVQCTDDENAVNSVTSSLTVDASGFSWTVQMREAFASDDSELAQDTQSEFVFVYLPYRSHGLIGGHILEDGSAADARGDFKITRADIGTYVLEIPNKGAQDGSLLLQVAGTSEEGGGALTSRAIIAYEHIPTDTLGCSLPAGCFKVVTRHNFALADDKPVFDPANTDFFFAWIDVANPVRPGYNPPPPPSMPPYPPAPAPMQCGRSKFGEGLMLGASLAIFLALGLLAVLRFFPELLAKFRGDGGGNEVEMFAPAKGAF